ncbi:ATP-binding protein [Arenicella xantha]|uniref:histidine kinase n=1 Tax=Arenicella xantha TaxID=644221 RepID=A0A395JJ78_9GAMM|nr:ATP-binding protein [Arenicella xantha]RBP50843.1 two-component system sensor histidine kinase PhoQ [Arenicella xantha]
MISLRRRLLVATSIVLVVFLSLMSVGLGRAFEQSVMSNAEAALRNQILLLIANLEVVDGQVSMPESLPEPRLSQTDSSLFAQIRSFDGQVVWQSRSLLGESLPRLASELGEFEFSSDTAWLEHPRLFTQSLAVAWETDSGDLRLTIEVAEFAQVYLDRIAKYQQQLLFWLLGLGAVLLTLLLVVLGWALNPLRKVIVQVGQIERGEKQRFDENYPLEVNRLTQNLNQLLNHESARIDRQKEVMGNLAHSLKTPIAVLSGLHYDPRSDADVRKQLSAMQSIIDYQLQSASAVGRRRFSTPIKIAEMSASITASLTKLHADKNIVLQLSIDPDLQFFGDQGDWMELFGNLADNAYKWARREVKIAVTELKPIGQQVQRNGVCLVVEDDGPGVDAELQDMILERGVRLDSQTPGHGLGLHIVKGIVAAYDGHISVANRPQGGARFVVELP